jgi:maltooligosyltrehalose trehalohydrolase
MQLGGIFNRDGSCRFTVWAPAAHRMALHIVSPAEITLPMERDAEGYWHASWPSPAPEARYRYRIGDLERPDPASHFQPGGVHEPSQLVDHASFRWSDSAWRPPLLSQLVIYELHVGTFTAEGTFDAIIPRLDALRELGVTAIEIMPVAQFPGARNWGYDGAYLFAVQNSYGGPDGLKRLVNECHRRSIAVILDVVYNHFGPEGCYVNDFGPYFTGHYTTPWGQAINFDDADNEGVRNFFIENALHWFTRYHIDMLRLDAVHGIKDLSAYPFLKELADTVHEHAAREHRSMTLIAESDLNDNRIVSPPTLGGFGIDAQWTDDFHHALHVLLTGETNGYYADFGAVECLAKTFREGFNYTGQYSRFRRHRFGNSPLAIKADQLVVFAQNHDQIGNRMNGERLSALVSFESQKLAAGVVLLSPFIPLLFMGEEYGEESPFLYFIDHSDPQLRAAVSEGRKKEFSTFVWAGDIAEPDDPTTFTRSKVSWNRRTEGRHHILLSFYVRLIRLRRELAPLACLDKGRIESWPLERERILLLSRRYCGQEVYCAFNFGRQSSVALPPLPPGQWDLIIDSAAAEWGGPDMPPAPVIVNGALTLCGSSFKLFEKRGD